MRAGGLVNHQRGTLYLNFVIRGRLIPGRSWESIKVNAWDVSWEDLNVVLSRLD